MGQYGRLALSAAGYMVGSAIGGQFGGFLGYMGGMISGMYLFPTKSPSLSLPSRASGRQVLVDGFSSTTLSTQVPVPIVFGKTMTNGNFCSAILLGEGNNRLLATIGLGEGSLALQQAYEDGVEFEKLSNYSATRDDKKSWIEFYDDGQPSTIQISNSGKKAIGGRAYQGESVTSYPIRLMADGGQVKFILQHWSPADGSSQTWDIKAKEQDHSETLTLVTGSGYYRKYVEYDVSDNSKGGSSTESYPVSGYTESDHQATLPYAGNWVFTLEVSQATNTGYIDFEAVQIIQDKGKTVTYDYYGTAYCLINLVKTAAIPKGTKFNFLVTGLTDNPAEALRTILEDDYFGLNISQEIDTASFESAAGWCSNKGYKINVAFLDVTYGEALELICNAGRLLLVRTGGIYKCIPEQDDSPVASFDETTNILPGSLTWGFIGDEHKFNRLRVKYTDEEEKYTLQDIILEDIAQVETDGYIRETTLDLSVVSSMTVANELGDIFFKKSKFIDTYIQFKIGLKDALVEVGDIIEVTSARLGFDAKKFRIMKIDEVENFGYQVYALEHFAEIYDPTITINNWHPSGIDLPETGTTAPSSIYIANINQDIIPIPKGYQAKGYITYSVPSDDPEFDHVELWVRPGYSTNWEAAGQDNTGSMGYNFPEAYTDYELKLVAVAPDGSKTDFANSPSTYFYPTLSSYGEPGYGGGRWGVQPYGS